MSDLVDAHVAKSAEILRGAIEMFRPTHIVSMVSGGKDSAASDQVAREIGAKIDLVMHGNTRCGIPETSDFVREVYARLGEFVEADAGTAYEDYVLRKGFFGKGIGAHAFSYRVLKAQPFRKAISKAIRHGKRDVRVLLLNGARKDESENRHARKPRRSIRHGELGSTPSIRRRQSFTASAGATSSPALVAMVNPTCSSPCARTALFGGRHENLCRQP